MRTPRVVGLGLGLLVGGCAVASPIGQVAGCPVAPASGEVRVSVERRANNALIADATVELANPAPIYLEYGSPELGWLRTPTTPPNTVHRLPLVHMRGE